VSRRRTILRKQVPADLLDIHDYLAKDSPATAIRFLDNARSTLERLATIPGIGSPKEFGRGLKGVRSWPVDGFPNHLVYYKFTDKALIILAILHGSRDLPKILRRRHPEKG
jgi:toxin ParE1/3/4